MSSKLKVNNIIPSTGTQIGISTTGGGINLLTGTVVTGIVTASGFDGPITQSGDFTIDDYIVHAGDTNTKFGFSAADTFQVETAGSPRFKIDSNGAIRNVTTARGDFYNGSYDARGLHLEGVSGDRRGWISLVNNSNNSGESVLMFGKTRGTSAGAVTIVNANDDLGVVHFSGSDGVDLRRAAEIRAQVDGTPAVNKVGGRLIFLTTANITDANPTERLRIDASGQATHTYDIGSDGDAGLILNTDDATKAPSILFRANSENRARLDVKRRSGDGGIVTLQVARADNSNNLVNVFTSQCATSGDTTPDLTLGGNLVLADGAGIDFSATGNISGTSSELLNDYEEGLFTPQVLINGSTSGVTQPGTRKGSYEKVGNVVHFRVWLSGTISYTGSGSHGLRIDGLPFTHQANTDYYGAVASWIYSGFSEEWKIISRHSLGSNRITMQRNDAEVVYSEVSGNTNFMFSGSYRCT